MKSRNKIPCCFVLKDIAFPMASPMVGTVTRDKLFMGEFDSSRTGYEKSIIKPAAIRCLAFLFDKHGDPGELEQPLK
jgi:hypothetical protein